MTLAEIKERLIEEGVASVMTEKDPNHQAGGVIGFNICRALETPGDFERVLRERRREEVSNDELRSNVDEYWKHRWATIQIQYVFDVMMVAWSQAGIVQPLSLSGRAMLRFQSIVTGTPIKELLGDAGGK